SVTGAITGERNGTSTCTPIVITTFGAQPPACSTIWPKCWHRDVEKASYGRTPPSGALFGLVALFALHKMARSPRCRSSAAGLDPSPLARAPAKRALASGSIPLLVSGE